MIIRPYNGTITVITYDIPDGNTSTTIDQNGSMKLNTNNLNGYHLLAGVCKSAKEYNGVLLGRYANKAKNEIGLLYSVPGWFSRRCFEKGYALVGTDQDIVQELDFSNGIPIDFAIESNKDELVSTVSMPYPDENCEFLTSDIIEEETKCVRCFNNACRINELDCYDKARATSGWARANGGQLLTQRVEDGVLYLTFRFLSEENLKNFCLHVAPGIYDQTMNFEHFVSKNVRVK